MTRSIRVLAPAVPRPLLAALAAFALLVGCAAPVDAPSATQRLRALIAAGDLASADALIASAPAELDARRALDLAIRGGHVDAVRYFIAATGPDAPLDPDDSTPLIRAVLDAPGPSRAELVALLVAAGADPLRADRYGRGPIDYATVRNRGELIALMGAPTETPAARRAPSFLDWFGTAPAGVAGAAIATGGRTAGAAAAAASRAGSGVASRSATGGTRAVSLAPADGVRDRSVATPRRAAGNGSRAGGPDASPAPASLLLRGSPWRPPAPPGPGAERAALRFHVDGTLDVLREPAGAVDAAPLPQAYGAWRLDAGGELRLAIVGPAFDVACLGRLDAGGTDPSAGRLELACEELPPPTAGAAWSLDRARAMLDRAGVPPAPSMLAFASGRVPLPGESRADDASHAMPEPARVRVALAGSAPLAACRPARTRPRTPQPSARVLGDWHAFDVRRFESRAPTSGALCPQTAARDAAMAACRADAGRDTTACRSVGGCPAGQVSVVAGLPGVEAGWIGCAADPADARRHALDACRADLGCDCQVAAVSGRNLLPFPGGAACPAPRR